jgi:hypothetical protein
MSIKIIKFNDIFRYFLLRFLHSITEKMCDLSGNLLPCFFKSPISEKKIFNVEYFTELRNHFDIQCGKCLRIAMVEDNVMTRIFYEQIVFRIQAEINIKINQYQIECYFKLDQLPEWTEHDEDWQMYKINWEKFNNEINLSIRRLAKKFNLQTIC